MSTIYIRLDFPFPKSSRENVKPKSIKLCIFSKSVWRALIDAVSVISRFIDPGSTSYFSIHVSREVKAESIPILDMRFERREEQQKLFEELYSRKEEILSRCGDAARFVVVRKTEKQRSVYLIVHHAIWEQKQLTIDFFRSTWMMRKREDSKITSGNP